MQTDSTPKTQLLTPAEVAEMLNISLSGVRRLIDQRQLPFHKVMRSIRFEKSDVLSYLQKHRVESVSLK